MDYNQLFVAIQSYTENQFPATYLENGTTVSPTQQINRFIQQAELRIYNTVQIPSLRKNVTGIMTGGNPYLSAPNDYLSTYSMAVIDPVTNAYEYLLNKDVNFIRESYPPPNSQGKPRYYAIFGSQYTDPNELSFIMGPTPDASYGVELHYYYYPESIVTANTTWLGDNFDSVLLYGTICEAFIYMRQESDMVKQAQDRYVQAIALYKNLADGKQRADAYRDGQARTAVA